VKRYFMIFFIAIACWAESPFSKRVYHLEQYVKGQEVDGCVIDSPVDIYYLTGVDVSRGRVIAVENRSTLFVDGRYISMCRELSPIPVLPFTEESTKEFLKDADIKKIGFDADHISYRNYEKLSSQLAQDNIVIEPLVSPLREIRLFKDPDEIEALKQSAAITWKGYEYFKSLLHEGMTEKEAALAFEFFCREHGAEELSFPAIIAFGENTAYPHHHCSNRAYREGDPVLIDIGVRAQGYCSDMTRMLLDEKTHPDVKELYMVLRKAHRAALELCRPGSTLEEIDLAARAVMKEAEMEELYVHALGHGVGLEVHEYPGVSSLGRDKKLILKPNMVITIEPGLYKPGVGGVRYEDTILITEEGYENFYPES
jgi:Xaa-Pro aminopeptidase